MKGSKPKKVKVLDDVRETYETGKDATLSFLLESSSIRGWQLLSASTSVGVIDDTAFSR